MLAGAKYQLMPNGVVFRCAHSIIAEIHERRLHFEDATTASILHDASQLLKLVVRKQMKKERAGEAPCPDNEVLNRVAGDIKVRAMELSIEQLDKLLKKIRTSVQSVQARPGDETIEHELVTTLCSAFFAVDDETDSKDVKQEDDIKQEAPIGKGVINDMRPDHDIETEVKPADGKKKMSSRKDSEKQAKVDSERLLVEGARRKMMITSTAQRKAVFRSYISEFSRLGCKYFDLVERMQQDMFDEDTPLADLLDSYHSLATKLHDINPSLGGPEEFLELQRLAVNEMRGDLELLSNSVRSYNYSKYSSGDYKRAAMSNDYAIKKQKMAEDEDDEEDLPVKTERVC